MTRVLLIVSADAAADQAKVAQGEAPRRDYLELARNLSADLFDFGRLSKGRTLLAGRSRLASGGLAQALSASRFFNDYDVVFSDNERVGVFVAMLLRTRARRARHVMLGHHLTPLKKRAFLLLARPGIDTLLLHSAAQRELAVSRLRFKPSSVRVMPYQVDTRFWCWDGTPQRDVVCSAGLECRDYPTLLRAAASLPIQVKIGAASNWSAKDSGLDEATLPANVEVRRYDYQELRSLYASSRFVVAPLQDVDFQAGITLILEAMAMARAVIATATRGDAGAVRGPLWQPGQTQWPNSGPSIAESTGIRVPPGNASALRAAMTYLLQHPRTAAALGENARRVAEAQYDIDRFTRLFCQAIAPQASPPNVRPKLDEVLVS